MALRTRVTASKLEVAGAFAAAPSATGSSSWAACRLGVAIGMLPEAPQWSNESLSKKPSSDAESAVPQRRTKTEGNGFCRFTHPRISSPSGRMSNSCRGHTTTTSHAGPTPSRARSPAMISTAPTALAARRTVPSACFGSRSCAQGSSTNAVDCTHAAWGQETDL